MVTVCMAATIPATRGVANTAGCRPGVRPGSPPGVRLQEGQHRPHAAVAVVVAVQAELGEDARDVLLHRALGDAEALGDAVVRVPLGHEREDLVLARRDGL